MNRCSTAQLRDREIINLCDGLRLGYADNFEFDLCDGRLIALLLEDRRCVFGFTKPEELRIPWDKIECIGEDTILVKLNPKEAVYCDFLKRMGKKSKIF